MGKKRLKKIARIFGITLSAIIFLIVIFIISLRFGFMQNFIKDRAISYLEDKIKTPVSLDRIYIGFPNSVEIKNLYLKGQDVDTLLYVKNLTVDLDMIGLINSKADITAIDLDGIRTNIIRKEDGSFNFDYITNAFASDKKEEKEKPFALSLDKIKLQDIHVLFNDLQTKNNIDFYFKKFDTRIHQFDIENNAYSIGDIFVEGLKLKLHQEMIAKIAKTVEKNEKPKNEKPIQLKLRGIKLKDFDVEYKDENSKTYANIILGELNSKINKLDLSANKYDIQYLSLKKTRVNAQLFLDSKKDNSNTEKHNKTEAGIMPFVRLRSVDIEDVGVQYSNKAVKPTPSGLDFNNLNFSKINLRLDQFTMNEGSFTGKIRSAEIKESRGLNIQKLHTDFAYTSKGAHLKNLLLQTPNTIIREEIVLSYSSLEQLSSDLGSVNIAVNIPNTKIGFRDILLFSPSLKNTAPFNKYPNAQLLLNSRIIGKVNDLNIHNLQASGIGDMKIDISGKLKNIMNPEYAYYDLRIKNISSSAKTLSSILPPKTLPNNINLPTQMAVSGNAKGTTKNINTILNITSTDGAAKLMGQIDMRKKNAENYTINADFNNLNLGKIIQNKDLGKISANINANGKNFNIKKGSANIQGQIKSLDYNKYKYQNIQLNGKISGGNFDLNMNSKDSNANMLLYAKGNYQEKKTAINIKTSIEKLDLYALNFYQKPMAIVGNIVGDFTNLNPDELNGKLSLEKFAIADANGVFPLQPIHIEAISEVDRNKLQINSQVADINLEGKYQLTQVFAALQNTMNEYYQFQKKNKQNNIAKGQYFTINGIIKNDEIIQKFVPEIKDFEPIIIDGQYQADTQNIGLNIKIPKLNYAQNIIEQGSLNIANNNETLQYKLHINKIDAESITLNEVNLQGDIVDDNISYQLITKDEKGTEQFLVAGTVQKKGNDTQISLLPNGLTLHYNKWNVNSENRLVIGKSGILAENFILEHNDSQIDIHSTVNNLNSPLFVGIKDFKIEDITEIIKKDDLLAKGNINGEVELKNLQSKMSFEGEVQIGNLEIYSSPIGNIDIKVKNNTDNTINMQLNLDGNENSISLLGKYNPSVQNFDMQLDIDKLQMKTIQGLSKNAIRDSEGFISGKLDLSGTTQNPQIIGKIAFNQVGMIIDKTGSNFRNINNEIAFQKGGLVFDQFQIKDLQGNQMTLDGKISTQNYRDFAFNLNLQADDFKVVDSQENQEQMMYGVLAIDADLKIKGDLDLPKVDGSMMVTENTDFTFVLPQSTPSLKDREGIVEFVDQDKIALIKSIPEEIDTDADLKGMDVNVNISVSKDAKVSLLIDKANGDFVKLQGEAELTGGIDPSGKTTLVGVYQVEKGAYEMSLSMLKRKFEIKKGSTITWTGEPTTAKLDLTAIYSVNAAPLDLLQQQLTSEQTNYYKQRIPFNTELKLKGELMKPIISFDITVDEEVSTISKEVLDNTKTKLEQLRTDEAEMNKQVFALLSLGRFVGENPFQSDSGQSTGTMLRQSVSQILSQQLNNLASNLVAGVDLSFDLDSYEDYSTGNKNTRTDLNVNLSKQLLNDRLKVTVGSNFGVEGDARQNEQMTNIAGNINLDYLISKDGRYKLKAYRKNDYQVALQGQIIETGVGFVITLDYDKFKQIFIKNKQNKEVKMLEKLKK